MAAPTALVISECQRGVIEPGMGGFAGLIDQVEARGIVARIAGLAAAFREADQPVLHLTVAHRSDFADAMPNSLIAALARKQRLMVQSTREIEIVPELAPAPNDFIVERSSGLVGFLGTPLDLILRRMGVRNVVMAGVSTNVAITGCTMVATDLGYQVMVAEDCIAAADPRTHAVIVQEQLRMVARIASADDIASTLIATKAKVRDVAP